MKVFSFLAATASLASAQNCDPSFCASDVVGGEQAYSCDALLANSDANFPTRSCSFLESQYACDCSGCGCVVLDGEITDPPDFSTTGVGGGPGGGGPGGGDGGGDGGGGDEQTIPPPPPIDIETAPPITGQNTPFPGTRDTPDPDSGGGDPIEVTPHGEPTAVTDPNAGPRTTTTKTTATPFVSDGTHTMPPIDKITTPEYVSTSHRTKYDCTKECGKPNMVGDSFCDDENNFCGCDWDNGDCCGTDNHYIYCTHCKCHDPAFAGIYNCPGDCADDDKYGDGYCDDGNNICACNWDGGDCCGTQNHYGFCTECKCVDPTWHDFKTPTCNGNCGSKNYIGDGFCDDDNNNCGCDWDNGDCCGNDNSYAHCDDCFCLDPLNAHHLDPAGGSNTECNTMCFSQGWFADGFCDDANNVCGCDWDGGDCCGGHNTYSYCDQCACLDPLLSDFYNCTTGGCENEDWQGDAYCDDGNNNCGCNWDGGDCCGSEHFYTYCDQCACLDPADMESLFCHGSCDVKAWKGDGYCDDSNNVCGCDWDGGDCCDHNAILDHCDDCQCLDPNYEADTACSAPCETLQWAGDGFCDDGNNICGCDWDNGDCCGASGESTQYAYCAECRCQDPDSSLFTAATETCTGVCYHTDWKADNFCDDGNNNCGCDWDGGDCCGTANSYKHCTHCACLDPDQEQTCQGECAHSGWAGDGFCDDGNNNCGCDWDGGDCCGDDKNYNQCTICACLEFATTDLPGNPQVTGFHTFEQISTQQPETPPPPPTIDGGNGGNGGGGATPPPDVHA